MKLFLKKLLIFLFCSIFFLFIAINTIVYFYGSPLVSYLSKNTITIEKFEYPVLPFYLSLKGIKFSSETTQLNIERGNVSLSSLFAVFSGKHFLNIKAFEATASFYSSNEKDENDDSNLDISKYLLLINSINIHNSHFNYKGAFELDLPIDLIAISYDKKTFKFYLNNVVLKKDDLSETLRVRLAGDMGGDNLYLNEGVIQGKYINLSMKTFEKNKDERFLKGYFDSEILKMFDVGSFGVIHVEGQSRKKNFSLHYEANMNLNKNNIVSKGELVNKRNRIYLNNDLLFNGNNITTNCEYNYKKALVLGDIILQDYKFFHNNPFKFAVNIKKKTFYIKNTVRLKDEYLIEGEGSFNDKSLIIKKFNIHSDSTSLNLSGVFSADKTEGKITGLIKNNSDLKEFLKNESHNISISGVLTLNKRSKSGHVNINFKDNPIYNIDSINVKIFGKESLKWLMNISMQNGLLNVNGDFINLNNWKIDYVIRDVILQEIGGKRLDNPSKFNGYGIVEKANNIYTSGALRINGIIPNQIDLRHYYDGTTLKIIAKNMLSLKIIKYNDKNYAFSTVGTIKDTPFKIDGVAGVENKVVQYSFYNISIDNLLLSASGNLDINNLVLDAFIENKKKDYPLKLYLKTDLTFKNDLFKITGQLDTREQYSLECNLKKYDNKISINKLNIASKSTNLSAYGDVKGSNIDVSISGAIENNSDILSMFNLKHSITLKSKVGLQSNVINYKADIIFNEDMFTFKDLESSGYFNIKSKEMNALTTVKSKHGIANINMNKKIEKPLYFSLSTEKMRSSIIEEIGKIKLDEKGFISASVKGEYDNELKIHGNLVAEHLYFEQEKLMFSYDNGVLSIDSLTLDDQTFNYPASYDFTNRYAKVFIEEDLLQNKYINAKNIYIDIKGPIDNLDINSRLTVNNTPIGSVDLIAQGNFNNLSVSLNSDNITVEAKYNKNDDDRASLDFLFYYTQSLKGEIPLIVEKSGNNNIKVTSNKSKITLNKKYEIYIEDLRFLIGKNGISDFNCLLSNDFFSNLMIKDTNIGLKGVSGLIDFNNSALKYEDIFNVSTNGQLYVSYNYSGLPKVNGMVSGTGLVKYGDLGIRLPIKQFSLEAKDYQVKLYALLYELESWLEVDFSANNYMNYLDSTLNFRGEHVYVNKMGFSGIFDFNLRYDKNKKELGGDVIIAKSRYSFENTTASVAPDSSKSIELPISININVKTDQPVIIESVFANASVNINLNVLYKKELKLRGKITTKDTEVVIGREKFIIYENYILFRGKIAPYLYLEARGTGSYNYVVLKIYGTLPNYKIDIMNLDPNSSSFYEGEGGYNPQNLLTDVFAGLLFNDVLKVTENILGINKIGFEQRAEGGKNVNYLKISRQFSDRFEIKYIIGSQEEESDVMMVGEYILLDWFKFSLYSQNRGGSGVGFTFFNDF